MPLVPVLALGTVFAVGAALDARARATWPTGLVVAAAFVSCAVLGAGPVLAPDLPAHEPDQPEVQAINTVLRLVPAACGRLRLLPLRRPSGPPHPDLPVAHPVPCRVLGAVPPGGPAAAVRRPGAVPGASRGPVPPDQAVLASMAGQYADDRRAGRGGGVPRGTRRAGQPGPGPPVDRPASHGQRSATRRMRGDGALSHPA